MVYFVSYSLYIKNSLIIFHDLMYIFKTRNGNKVDDGGGQICFGFIDIKRREISKNV